MVLRTTSLSVPKNSQLWHLHLRTPLWFFFFSCIKITVMGISWNNKEITPLLLETIQKHKEGLQLRNITVTAARPCLIIVSCCIDLITALLCSEKGIFPFCPTLPWPFLTEESWVGGSEVSTSMEHVCEGGWATSKGTQSIFYENSLMQSSLSFPSVQTNALLSPYHTSDVFALLPAGLTDLPPSVPSRQLAWALLSFSVPQPSLHRSFLHLSPNPCSVNGRAV